jgi:hypothetical protein
MPLTNSMARRCYRAEFSVNGPIYLSRDSGRGHHDGLSFEQVQQVAGDEPVSAPVDSLAD